VLLDEAARAAHQIEPHQITPVIGILTLLKGGQRAHRTLIPRIEGAFTNAAHQLLRANAQVIALFLAQEEAQLRGEVKIALVVRGG
jgi:hypothetical protein